MRRRFPITMAGSLLAWLSLGTSYSVPRVVALVEDGPHLLALVHDDAPAAWRFDGATWSPVEGVDERVDQGSTEELDDPLVPGRRYRLDDWGVLVSDAGGAWTDAWTVPPARRPFVSMTPLRSPKPRDIAVLPSDPSRLVVAMGTEGVLVRDRTGQWTPHGLGATEPTPQSAEWGDLPSLIVRGQWIVGAMVGLLGWWLASVLAWRRASTRPRRDEEAVYTSGMGLLRTIGPAVLLALFVPTLALGNLYPHELFLFNAPAGLIALAWSILVRRGWQRMAPWLARPPGRWTTPTVLGTGTLGLLPLLAWDLGWIARLEAALGWTALATVLGLFISVVLLSPRAGAAANPQ